MLNTNLFLGNAVGMFGVESMYVCTYVYMYVYLKCIGGKDVGTATACESRHWEKGLRGYVCMYDTCTQVVSRSLPM